VQLWAAAIVNEDCVEGTDAHPLKTLRRTSRIEPAGEGMSVWSQQRWFRSAQKPAVIEATRGNRWRWQRRSVKSTIDEVDAAFAAGARSDGGAVAGAGIDGGDGERGETGRGWIAAREDASTCHERATSVTGTLTDRMSRGTSTPSSRLRSNLRPVSPRSPSPPSIPAPATARHRSSRRRQCGIDLVDVDFHWTAVANANGYRVWASINGGAFAPIGTTAAATTLHITFSSGSIGWFVEALFNGCASVPSTQSSFTIAAAQAATTPLLASGSVNNSTLTNSEVDFSWSSGEHRYELWLAINNARPRSLARRQPQHPTNGRRRNCRLVRPRQFTARCDRIGARALHLRTTGELRPDRPISPLQSMAPPWSTRTRPPMEQRSRCGIVQSLARLRRRTRGSHRHDVRQHLDNQNVPSGASRGSLKRSSIIARAAATSSTFTAAPLRPHARHRRPLPRAESTASTTSNT